MSIELLSQQNLWWTDPENIYKDPYIEEFTASPFKWYPEFIKSSNLDEDLVYILWGPRQVGKTTSFKLLIKTLLKDKGVNPRSILYLNCDELTPQTPQKLAEFIDEYLSWVRLDLSCRLYIFIDEATYIKDWQRGVKILADRGQLKGVTLFATGSHMMGLRRGGERLPGRRGRGTKLDIPLLPLSFRDYIINYNNDLKEKLPKFPGWDFNRLFKACQEFSLYSKVTEPIFTSYLRTGGFPRPIRDKVSFGHIKPDIYKIYRDAMVGDLVRMGKRESIFRELSQWIITRRQNPFEWSDVSRETYIGTHPTIREYIEDAEASFVWDIFYKIKEIGKPLRAPRSPKKVLFKDPFIFHSIRTWILGYQDPYQAEEEFLRDPGNLGYLIENMVASGLRRIWAENVYYWKDGGEIDFVIFKESEKTILIELKYQNKVSLEDAKTLIRWGGGIVLTKDFLAHKEKILFVPVHYFLALI